MTLADPLEGADYGRGKAKILLRANGTPWINSFAHGRTTYELKYDSRSVRAAIEKAAAANAARILIQLSLMAELDAQEYEELRNLAAERAGINKRTIDAQRKAAFQKQRTERADEERKRRLAERNDPRPQIDAPEPNAPWLPAMQTLNDTLAPVIEPQPSLRDIDGTFAQIRQCCVPDMHAFTADRDDNQ